MTSLPDLIKQRDNLDAEIAQRQREERDTWDNRLDELHGAVQSYADHWGIATEIRNRKNIDTITIDGRVAVELGYHDDSDRGLVTWFGVASSKMRVSFDNGLPTPAELTGLVDGILNPERPWRKT